MSEPPQIDRHHALLSLAAALGQSDVASRAADVLGAVVLHAERLGLSRTAIADACGESVATVDEWTDGVRPEDATAAIAAIRDLAVEAAGD